RIDTRLRACNPAWQIIPWNERLDTSALNCHALTEFPTANGPADYALFVSGALLGILEAKKVTVGPQNVLEQAKRYASGATTETALLAGQRELLIAMATGTGKTFLIVAQIYRLLESKQFRRILFLVDRKALAAQAVRTFNAFDTPQGNKLTQEYEVYSQRFQK